MIIVTGGAGFIGSNMVRRLNEQGFTEILVVDDLQDGTKFKNLVDCTILDYCDKDTFYQQINRFGKQVSVVFHEGACAETTNWDGKYMLENNYENSKILLNYCVANRIPLIYASSAAVYGKSTNFREDGVNEHPLNIYAYSKLLFDQYVRRVTTGAESQVVGLRYFNVYGPYERHKGAMASVILHFYNQIIQNSCIKLFAGTDGYGDGEQKRDFIHVDDIVNVNIWMWQNPKVCGIFNVGTGIATSFNEVAQVILKWFGKGSLQYIPFPENLRGSYQNFTQADINKLQATGYEESFIAVKQGIESYLATF